MIRRCKLFASLLAVGLALMIGSAPALAVDGADLLGAWPGFSHSSNNDRSNPPVNSFFDVFTDLGDGFFQGQVTITIIPCIFPGIGHVTKGGVVDFHGMEEGTGETLDLRGVLRVLGDGSVRLLAARWAIREGRQIIDSGYGLWLLRFGGLSWTDPPEPVNVMGEWSGRWLSLIRVDTTGMADSMIDWQMGTGLSGDLFMFGILPYIEQDNLIAMMHGTVGNPLSRTNRMARPIAMIGADSRGTVAILIGLLLPAVQTDPTKLVGRYHLFDSFFDVFTEFLNPRKGTAFDRGVFELPAVQSGGG